MNDRNRGRGSNKPYSSYNRNETSQGPSSITPVSNNDDSKGSGGGGEGVGGSSGGAVGGDQSQPQF